MCGICGILNLRLDPDPDLHRIDAMSARIVHRGPDSAGKFELPYLALAIRRLSIIDLETGDQPLKNESGCLTLIFNGEIYNYRELRSKLIDRGHQFRTHGDGEVIVHLYEELGLDFVNELNGMFAMALWDQENARLVLARDRAGEKPLFYSRQVPCFVFASEIKALLEYPKVARTLDAEAIRQYLSLGYTPAPRTVFEQIRKLPAGHRMVVERGAIRIEPYWELRRYVRGPGSSVPNRTEVKALVTDLRGRLREAAVSRLVSDVPLGVFLSGGVDSSTLVALMSDLSPGNIDTFSVAFSQRSFNEEPYANFVARHFHSRHHVLPVGDGELVEGLQFLAGHLDEPLADPAVIPTHLLSRFAREHIKVGLSGEGSDELFGGYPTYLGARLAEYYLRLPGVVRTQFFKRLQKHLPVSPGAVPMGLFLRRFFAYAEMGAAERHLIWFGMLSPSEVDQAMSPEFRGLQQPQEARAALLREAMLGLGFEDTLAELLYLDFHFYLQDNLLVKVDRASMVHSLELRTPFLDQRLIEFAASIPAKFKVRRFHLKYILKEAVRPWLPRRIVGRQKRGFSVPTAGLLRTALRKTVDEAFAEDRLRSHGLFDSAWIRKRIEEHREGKADHRKSLWTLLCFQLWHERWGGA
ncbi:MAG: asparagine synthase (glutamine-hydrolyzing) [Terriglobia bacterium]